MPTLYVLVGVPCSGKTTWANEQTWAKDCAYISTDKHLEKYAKSVNKSQTEVFTDYMPRAVELMVEDVVEARERKRDIIWDQTSTTVVSRERKFRMLPDYRKIAVVFETPDFAELQRRNNRPGKFISDIVMKKMIEEFQFPTLEEGFDEIWYAI